ncbi:MAG TPA: 3-hydroxyacyl-[acyl-carrier-protein] dehydratase FabZ [Ruminococcaceae bacterium]|nr:3-hydroxyacyl-[acyl-carrier-protein] dehydratase FabZ [Oscillospiraceae bacterium]
MLNREQIMDILPHRPPFLLVDEITELQPGQAAVGIKNVSEDEYYFKGHFPGQPVMPGVLMVEALAQVGAVAVLSMPEYKGKIAFLGSVREAKFRGIVTPGDRLRLEVELTRMKGRVGVGKCKAYKEDKAVCQCEITFIIEK